MTVHGDRVGLRWHTNEPPRTGGSRWFYERVGECEAGAHHMCGGHGGVAM